MNPSDLKTPDLYFAAYLVTEGIRLTDTDRHGGRTFFIFENALSDPRFDALKSGWLTSSGKVDAAAFAATLNRIRFTLNETRTR